MYIELHLIQNFAPANLNRDDTNNPKDCEFGGVRRARISSQCIKRAIRKAPVFTETTGMEIGQRTKRVIERLRKQIGAAKPEAEVNAILPAFVPAFLSKMDKDGQRTAVLLYLSATEIEGISNKLLENWAELADEKKRTATAERLAKELTKEYKGRTSAPDIALFGRMLAEKPELNLDAACQVAHALSTHRVTMEMDFYTAVDDLNPDDTAGAGMMGFTGYNSACFYRYARLDWDQLVKNLGEDRDLALRTVEGFLRATVEAVPTGKQNTFAAQNPPSFLLAVVRNGGAAWSLANAFEKPVRAERDSGLVAPSVKALDGHWGRLHAVYGKKSIAATAALALDDDLELTALKGAQVKDLEAWIAAVTQPIKEAIA
ncbi:MAG: type I-E CRISPR-associated protein Cas7/Cse4/CasC [Anaerolineae bacterium CG2_30_64_16]|nr:MAG: type I-E CRISPR-associated protein Cas7/Cse4/CasC [Anaerolineae bacterium CG2_30_64_16]